MDGVPVSGAEALAQLLRTATARGSATLAVRRAGELVELRVVFSAA